MAHGNFCWHDLMTTDLEAAKAFYPALLGWTLNVDETHAGPYVLFHDGHNQAGGMMTMDAGSPAPSHWMPYVTVDDLVAALAQVKELGGAVHHGPFPVPNVGQMAVISDPQGAFLNVIQLDDPEVERQRRPLPGEFCWYSLMTPDIEAAKAFYTPLFGWEVQVADLGAGATQEVFIRNGAPIAGLTPPQGPGAAWGMAVAAVGGLDACHAKALSLGATQVMPPSPVGNFGRMSLFAGPSGEVLSLFEAAGE